MTSAHVTCQNKFQDNYVSRDESDGPPKSVAIIVYPMLIEGDLL
jgi:hypothetical protein